MDGESVESDSPSYATFTEAFFDVFPQYLAMGMTSDEFWNGNPLLVKSYRKAYQLRQKAEEWARWRNGMYVYAAIGNLAPILRASFGGCTVKPKEYMDKPFPMTEEEAKQQEEERQSESIKKMLAVMRRESADNQRRQLEAKEAKSNADD